VSKLGERTGAEGDIVVCAVIVGGVWAFRTLYETGKAAVESKSSPIKELSGLSAHPAHPAQFIVGFGFVFFTLSVIAIPAPEFAKMFAVLIAVGTTLANGASLFTDVNTAVGATATLESGSTTQLVTPKASSAAPAENQTVRSKA
jgi:hypothetical protein